MSLFTPQPQSYQHDYPSNYPPVLEELQSHDIALEVRQQPRQALLTAPKKERNRKPVDPPVVVQMKVSRRSDPTQLFLHNPSLFAVANLENELGQTVAGNCLIGNITSSLHRLKEVDSNGSWGQDGGFFVFGDVSVAKLGKFRFCFSIFELRKEEVVALGSVHSDPFNVVNAKDYLGLEESSFLTRAFVDQGVRLRLRKEQRSNGGSRVRRDTKSTQDEDDTTSLLNNDFKPFSSYQDRRTPPQDESPRPMKRARTSFGSMYPGVQHSTRGWGAFNSADMTSWQGGGRDGQISSLPSLTSEPDLSMNSRALLGVPFTQSGLQQPIPQLQLPMSRSTFDWRSEPQQRQTYQSVPGSTGLTSPPNSGSGNYETLLSRPQSMHQSLQAMGSGSPTRLGYQISSQFQQSPERLNRGHQMHNNPTYIRQLDGSHRRTGSAMTSEDYQRPTMNAYGSQDSFEEQPTERHSTPSHRSLGLQTLASASEQQPYIAPSSRTLPSSLSAPQGTLGIAPMSMSPSHPAYPITQSISAYSPTQAQDGTFDAAQNLRQLQQAFRPDTTSSAPSFPFHDLP